MPKTPTPQLDAAAAAAADVTAPDAEPTPKSELGKVKVPQNDGEITMTSGDDVRRWVVKDGEVTPASHEERELLLLLVPGAH